VWAGYDAVVKANNSVDITASQRDVRLKAHRNFQALGGLSGEGAVLLESKAICAYHDYEGKYGEDVVSSGVVLRADKSQVIAIARDMVFTNNCPEVTEPGNMVMDFGTKKIVTHSALFERHLETAMEFFPGGITNEWWATGAMVGTGISIVGPARVLGYLAVDDWIYSTAHIGTALASSYNYAVGQETPDSVTSLNDEFDHITARTVTLQNYQEEAEADLVFRDGMCGAHFSFRTPEQYRTDGGKCTVHEAHWQRVARLSLQALPAWQESTLTMLDGKHLQPFPGYEEWETNTNFLDQDLALYSTPDGYRNARATYQDEPEYGASSRQTIADHYSTIRSI
jgi:hypothetical protein